MCTDTTKPVPSIEFSLIMEMFYICAVQIGDDGALKT